MPASTSRLPRRSLRPSAPASRCAALPGSLWACRPPCGGLSLRELEPLAHSRTAVLLPLDHARVARQEPRLLQGRPEVRVQFGERPADAVPDGAGLSRQAAAADVHVDVDLADLLDHFERLLENHLARLA